ncbi:hypothetical protein AB0E01_43520 [Nocardia vinacea]|uniref:hypothetical protein n=1 Tax=Nocardia vinacea TaxID=96468 RepID=UPI0033CFF0F6
MANANSSPRPRWLIEGNYAGTLPIRLAAAAMVIFIDLPAMTCLEGIVRRHLRHHGGQHTNGVYGRITWSFLRYVWGYRTKMRPKAQRLIADHGSHVRLITLGSRRQIAQFVNTQNVNYLPPNFRRDTLVC